MSAPELELFLARLYTDRILYERFITNPELELQSHHLSQESIEALREIDIQGLKLAVGSYHHKRMNYQKIYTSLWRRIKNILCR
jgi:hypothetical protein